MVKDRFGQEQVRREGLKKNRAQWQRRFARVNLGRQSESLLADGEL
jgi:hypothetical protein